MAICRPLHYITAMSPGLCILLLTLCWALSVLYGLFLTLLMTKVTFCGSRRIHYIFCEMYVLLRLACSNTQMIHTVLITTGCFIFFTPLGVMVMSYVWIVRAILRIPSASSKYKAFSTCGSHLAVVSLFYGTLSMVYLLWSWRSWPWPCRAPSRLRDLGGAPHLGGQARGEQHL